MRVLRKLQSILQAGELKRFFLGSLMAFGIKIGSAGLAFLMFVGLARAMDADTYGVFATLFSLATFAAVVGNLGQSSNVIRFAAKYHTEGHDDLRRGVVRFGYWSVFVGTITASLCAVAIAWLWLDLPKSATLLLGLAVLTLGLGLVEFQSRALRVFAPVALSLVPRDIVWRALICLSALAVILRFGRQSETAALWVWGLGLSLLVITYVQWLIYEKRVPEGSFRGSAAFDTDVWRKNSGGAWLSLIVTAASLNISVLFVGWKMEFEQAGAFFSALRVAQLLNLFMLATEVILLPSLSRAVATGDWEKVQRFSKLTALLGGGFSLLGAAFFVLFGEFLLGLFGPETLSAYSALLILTAGFVINTCAGPTSPLMHMSGHASSLAMLQLFGMVLGLSLMPIAIDAYGMEGAAGAIALSIMTWNIGAWIFARRKLGIDPTIFALIAPPNPNKPYPGRDIGNPDKTA